MDLWKSAITTPIGHFKRRRGLGSQRGDFEAAEFLHHHTYLLFLHIIICRYIVGVFIRQNRHRMPQRSEQKIVNFSYFAFFQLAIGKFHALPPSCVTPLAFLPPLRGRAARVGETRVGETHSLRCVRPIAFLLNESHVIHVRSQKNITKC